MKKDIKKIKKELEAVRWVCRFLGQELTGEVFLRFHEGQSVGQALSNAGDHADQRWSWEISWETWSDVKTWKKAAKLLKRWHYSFGGCDDAANRDEVLTFSVLLPREAFDKMQADGWNIIEVGSSNG